MLFSLSCWNMLLQLEISWVVFYGNSTVVSVHTFLIQHQQQHRIPTLSTKMENRLGKLIPSVFPRYTINQVELCICTVWLGEHQLYQEVNLYLLYSRTGLNEL